MVSAIFILLLVIILKNSTCLDIGLLLPIHDAHLYNYLRDIIQLYIHNSETAVGVVIPTETELHNDFLDRILDLNVEYVIVFNNKIEKFDTSEISAHTTLMFFIYDQFGEIICDSNMIFNLGGSYVHQNSTAANNF